MHIHASVDLGFLAAKAAVLVAYALAALITAGIDAGACIVDAALGDEPALGAPAPDDEADGCWLLRGLSLDLTPTAGYHKTRFTR